MVIENDHKAKGRLISNSFKEKGSTHKDIQSQRKGGCQNSTYSQDKERNDFHYNEGRFYAYGTEETN